MVSALTKLSVKMLATEESGRRKISLQAENGHFSMFHGLSGIFFGKYIFQIDYNHADRQPASNMIIKRDSSPGYTRLLITGTKYENVDYTNNIQEGIRKLGCSRSLNMELSWLTKFGAFN